MSERMEKTNPITPAVEGIAMSNPEIRPMVAVVLPNLLLYIHIDMMISVMPLST